MSTDIDRETMKRDLHGGRVDSETICDGCSEEIDTEIPVRYDVIRVDSLPELEQQLIVPDGWIPDMLRCPACEIECIEPATKGIDEACVVLRLNESNGLITIDSSSLKIVDCSTHTDGYHPPSVHPGIIDQLGDLGMARWQRVKEYSQLSHPAAHALCRQIVEVSKEVPPEI